MKKTYFDCLNEITSDELFDGLLGHGLFADKLPPFLTSECFLNFCKNPPNGFTFDNNSRLFIKYESMRNINIPRLLSIPHPIAYRNQCQTIKDNWKNIKNFFKNKTKNNSYKISRIHIRKIDHSLKIFETCYENLDDINLDEYPQVIQKHLFEMNHKNFCVDDYPEPKLLIGKRYIVKADISNCFPSVYSHSIPWALVGKKYAKEKENRNDNLWFNQIDKTTRNLKDEETHGILIGPHTSNLISEIILVVIDEKLSDKGYQYTRNIDDYSCYVQTYEDAENFLLDLSKELKQFNLTLNHKKTEILELPLASVNHWVRKLSNHVFISDEKLSLKDVRSFLDIALELMKENKDNSAILNYAIKILSKKEMTKYAKEYFIDTIHHLVLLYPYLITLLEKNVFEPFELSCDELQKIAKNIYDMAHKKNLYEAMSYAIYFAIKNDFKIQDDLYDMAESSRDTILMLLCYSHDKKFSSSRNFIRTTLGKKYKELAKELQSDMDEYWLFVYEVLSVGLLDREWKAMKKNNVSFIKDGFIG